jgi:hypothetical protein
MKRSKHFLRKQAFWKPIVRYWLQYWLPLYICWLAGKKFSANSLVEQLTRPLQ